MSSIPRRRRLVLALTATAALAMSTTAAFGGSVTYVYDNLGRLKKATYSNGVVITYSYDEAGNRTSVVTSGA